MTSNPATFTFITITPLGSGFSSPTGVAVDSSGNIYVVDLNINGIKKMDANGTIINTLGSSSFSYPTGVAVDRSGNIYVANPGNNAIMKMDPTGTTITPLGSGSFSAAPQVPQGVAVDSNGNIYVADYYNNTIYKMDPTGTPITQLGSGTISSPTGVAVDSSGNIYVAEVGNSAITKMDPTGTTITTLGTGFSNPQGVAVDSSGNIYVADYGNNAIKKMDPTGTTITTLGTVFSNPQGVTVDSNGNIYVADYGNSAIKKIAVINQDQTAPTGLSGVSPTAAENIDGQITGVSGSMEYQLKGTTSFTAITASTTSITGLAAGTYEIRYAAKTGFNAGTATEVVVAPTAGCLVTYQGAQERANTVDPTAYDIRFLATIDTLNASSVGFVFSKSEMNPTKVNSTVKSTTTVYNSITASGLPVYATDLNGTYIIACTVTGIPATDIGTPLIVRAFSTVGTETTYTSVKAVTVSSLIKLKEEANYMKKAYEKPLIEIEEFEIEDIMASSLTMDVEGTGDEIGYGSIH